MKSNVINIIYKLLLVLLGAGVSAAVFLVLFSGLWKYRAIDSAIKSTSAHEYDDTEYNCINFSQDAVATLKLKNIDSNIVVLKQDSASPKTHTVIGIWIDPQNGQFVSGAEYAGDYNELKNQFGWANR